MFSRIQARRYRSLKAIDQDLGAFQALIGPNASGKTTFLDVIAFLSDLIRNRGDVRETTAQRSADFQNLLWKNEGDAFQLAVEAKIPKAVQARMDVDNHAYHYVRYEIEVGLSAEYNTIGLNHEKLWLLKHTKRPTKPQRELFPDTLMNDASALQQSHKGLKSVLGKKPKGNDNYYPEGRATYNPTFRLGPTKSALANLPADEESFPVGTWFRDLLEHGVQRFILNSQIIRQPSPPGLGRTFQPDGSNLPWVIAELRKTPERFDEWLGHIRTALPDIRDIDIVERLEDRHRYLVVIYDNGARVPSWLVSDGTLRLLALTIPAYLTDLEGVFLIEEPENGVHPRAMQTVLQSLRSMYDSQVLLATHSTVALTLIDARDVLCFAKNADGATDVVAGHAHPALRDWQQGKPDLGVLFASGILS